MDDQSQHSEDPLDRAIDAFVRQPDLGSFPSDRILRNLGVSRDDAGQQIPVHKRKLTMRFLMKIAAALVLAGALATLVYTSTATRSLAFEQVADKIREAKTMTAEAFSDQDGHLVRRMKVYYKDPGMVRFENGDFIGIANTTNNDLLFLNVKDKTGVFMHAPPKPGEEFQIPNWLDKLKKNAAQEGKPVGERDLDNHPARGFETVDHDTRMIIWADAKTGAPLRMEVFFEGAKAPLREPLVKGAAKLPDAVIDHIHLDEELADSLFSTKLPEGYKAPLPATAPNFDSPTEKDLIDLLKIYTTNSGGKFPAEIGQAHWPATEEFLPKHAPNQSPSDTEQLAFSVAVIRATNFLDMQTPWHYTGTGVTTADKDKPVFWMLNPDGKTAHVIYGDLHTGDVDPKGLPQGQNPQAPPPPPTAVQAKPKN